MSELKEIYLSSAYLGVNRKMIKKLGADAAFLLSCFIEAHNMFSDEDGWFFQTEKQIEELTGMKRSKQLKIINMLVEANIIEKENKGIPCKRYFKLNEEIIVEMLKDSQEVNEAKDEECQFVENSKLDCRKRANKNVENSKLDCRKRANKNVENNKLDCRKHTNKNVENNKLVCQKGANYYKENNINKINKKNIINTPCSKMLSLEKAPFADGVIDKPIKSTRNFKKKYQGDTISKNINANTSVMTTTENSLNANKQTYSEPIRKLMSEMEKIGDENLTYAEKVDRIEVDGPKRLANLKKLREIARLISNNKSL